MFGGDAEQLAAGGGKRKPLWLSRPAPDTDRGRVCVTQTSDTVSLARWQRPAAPTGQVDKLKLPSDSLTVKHLTVT